MNQVCWEYKLLKRYFSGELRTTKSFSFGQSGPQTKFRQCVGSMICWNGGQLASSCLNGKGKQMVAARGFFEVFWRWSRAGCEGIRRGEEYQLIPRFFC